MRVLLSAYACEPEKGSEPEVGYQALLAAASRHDVWVLTRTNNVDSLNSALADHPFASRVHLEGFEVPGIAMKAKRLGLPGLHWYYDAWQRRASERALELEASIGFDVVHHATFATYWTRAGVASLGKPFVWGPVGGGVGMPLSLLPVLGLRGAAEDALRYGARAVLGRSRWIRDAARAASVILVQNRETADALPTNGAEVHTLPNATSAALDDGLLPLDGTRNRHVLLAGRLVAWKGASLALRAMACLRNKDARLKIYGDGPDASRIRRFVRAMGLERRVEFMGHTPREDLLAAVAAAGCVIHPAMHDDSPLGVAEALSLGSPIVCLDHGGPAELIRWWPQSPARLVTPQSLGKTVASLASAVDSFLDNPPLVPPQLFQPTRSFRDEILAAYEKARLRSADS